MSGRRMTSVCFITDSASTSDCRLADLGLQSEPGASMPLAERLLQLFDRAPGHDDPAGVDRPSRAVSRALATKRDAGNVADRPRQLVVDRDVDQHRLAARRRAASAAPTALFVLISAADSSSTTTSAPLCIFVGQRRAQRAELGPSSAARSRSCAAAARTPCRHGATAGCESSRCARGRCPSAATASCRCR